MVEQNTPAGWFPQTDGRLRYWDGTRWTDQFQDAPPAAPVGASVPPGGPAVDAPKTREKKKNWFLRHRILTGLGVIVLLAIAVNLGGGGDDETATPAASSTAKTSSPAASSPAASSPAASSPAASSPAASSPAAKSGEDVMLALAQIAGAKTTDAACIEGISWMCNIEYAQSRSGVVEIRVRTTEQGVSGDDVARAAYNFLTLGSERDITMVQVTTTQDGAIGSFSGNY